MNPEEVRRLSQLTGRDLTKLAAPGGGPESAGRGDSTVAESPNFVDSVTPSGIEIRYHWVPKRKYEIRGPKGLVVTDFRDSTRWNEVPSVTTVLDVLNKPGLPWWGMKVGVRGVWELCRQDVLGSRSDWQTPYENRQVDPDWDYKGDAWIEIDEARVIDLLTRYKLTVNHQRDKAGDRGVVVHDAFETWCKTGIIPDPAMFAEEERGYVLGLRKFLTDIEPDSVAAEVMVGSLAHGYAGRYDARIYVPRKCEVVYKHTPKRGAHRAVLAPGTLLVDLKTSSGVYPSHELQLAAYELGSVECGYGPSDGRGIIHVMPDGNYEFFRARAEPQDFLDVLAAYRAIEKFKKKDR